MGTDIRPGRPYAFAVEGACALDAARGLIAAAADAGWEEAITLASPPHDERGRVKGLLDSLAVEGYGGLAVVVATGVRSEEDALCAGTRLREEVAGAGICSVVVIACAKGERARDAALISGFVCLRQNGGEEGLR